jgi:hypothetical protein
MKQLLTIVAIFFTCFTSYSQLDDASINKFALQLEQSYRTVVKDNNLFAPMNMLNANMDLFVAEDKLVFTAIKKLVAEKKFKTNKDALNWFLPKLNKAFMIHYSETLHPVIIEHKAFFQKLIPHLCAYRHEAFTAKDDIKKYNIHKYLTNQLPDTSLRAEYNRIVQSSSTPVRLQFVSAMSCFCNIHCKDEFDNSMIGVVYEMPGYFEEMDVSLTKGDLLEKSILFFKKTS